MLPSSAPRKLVLSSFCRPFKVRFCKGKNKPWNSIMPITLLQKLRAESRVLQQQIEAGRMCIKPLIDVLIYWPALLYKSLLASNADKAFMLSALWTSRVWGKMHILPVPINLPLCLVILVSSTHEYDISDSIWKQHQSFESAYRSRLQCQSAGFLKTQEHILSIGTPVEHVLSAASVSWAATPFCITCPISCLWQQMRRL